MKITHISKERMEKPKQHSVNQIFAADELIKFKGLLDQGVITQEEFDKKEKELLG